ncbi:sigma-70 family RNA polymerase sigma factor [Pedobacter sp. BS3]|uniref:sigma-70 family RNA polymerase sigma factor n=1 Tax=Pedobacter sp. BS3 TaxID=2567937 RepID=UPI0011EF4144|nr:sigma-70 family RNA polymerase sigma factor [Pedobacter sp. BS3]
MKQKTGSDKYQNHLVNHSPQHSETIDNWLLHKELSQLVASSINQLPERCKMVFMLKREENLSNKEISERLNISANTVEQHMRKALSRLKTSLAHYLSLIVACMFLNCNCGFDEGSPACTNYLSRIRL